MITLDVVSALLLIPPLYSVVDLAVDVLGVANRRSGGYSLVRAAGMGYFFGDGDDSACRSLSLLLPS